MHGQVHIVVMSTEHDFRPGSLQYRFLSKYLETKVNRTETPWLIFSGHRYNTTLHEDLANPFCLCIIFTISTPHVMIPYSLFLKRMHLFAICRLRGYICVQYCPLFPMYIH